MIKHTLILLVLAILVAYSDQITDGKVAADGQYPFLVSLKVIGRHICGGSILNKFWILTAAHCVENIKNDVWYELADLKIMVGSNTLDPSGKIYEVDHVIIHPHYDTTTIQNDIALIRIKDEIKFSKKVQKIRLQTKPMKAGQSFTVAGWGRFTSYGTAPNYLYFIETKSLTTEECEKRFDDVWNDSQIDNFEKGGKEICVFGEVGEGVCYGDSGGPLVHHEHGEVRVAGIVSYGQPCGRGYPDVFTRVYSYVHWIHKQINKEGGIH